MRSIVFMTEPEERRLMAEVKRLGADPARRAEYVARRNEFAERWLPLVRAVIRKRFPGELYGDRHDDLIQVGSVEVVRSVDKFDRGLGLRFSTFVTKNVWGAVHNHLRFDTVVRVPKHQKPGKKDAFEADRNRACFSECGDFLDSVHDHRAHGDAADEADRLACRADALATALARLPDREWLAVSLRFGLTGEDPWTLVDIGRMLGTSKEWVRQIEAVGLSKIKKQLEEAGVAA